ncbi:MotA/TolQ/ExbB proton channel family protein [Rhodocyclus tenuis]|uniref:MotA/TolQ/ExbB proton channel family protein n=1 Tax=Rhodocyclus tenuis TaxID=1066 RepID=UPI0019042275|nr:MotA/TolQ/ExbB proton channel family protein [Rhodocyclus tenuis]MBK1680856.1 hypothetical protein [Rhodocyclus tenuis]
MADSGLLHFLAGADTLARVVLALLLLMSLLSWYQILGKGLRTLLDTRRQCRFLAAFRQCRTVGECERQLPADTDGSSPAAARVAAAAFAAGRRWRLGGGDLASAAGSEFIERAVYRETAKARVALESGLSTLAAIASTAPFVGLFGTVCSIYHALLAIGQSGQGGIDRVAGPVAESLIMTAIGLAVAIPAALAHNAFVRSGRLATAELEDFGEELQSLLASGVAAPQAGQGAPAWPLGVSREAT